MFSRYKKSEGGSAKKAGKSAPGADADADTPKTAPADAPAPISLRRPAPKSGAEAAPMDKERKRKERLGEIKIELHRSLLDHLNLGALESATETDLRAEIGSIAEEVLQERNIVLNREDRTTLTQELYDEVRGLGPLETLLKDETVNDILVNGPHQIFVEREGKLMLSDVTFKDERHLLRIIDKIVSAVGRRVDESNPYVDARLADGSRFNAMVPPVAVDGSLVSKRTSWASTIWWPSAPFPRKWPPIFRPPWPRASTSSCQVVPVPVKQPRSTRCRRLSTTPNVS